LPLPLNTWVSLMVVVTSLDPYEPSDPVADALLGLGGDRAGRGGPWPGGRGAWGGVRASGWGPEPGGGRPLARGGGEWREGFQRSRSTDAGRGGGGPPPGCPRRTDHTAGSVPAWIAASNGCHRPSSVHRPGEVHRRRAYARPVGLSSYDAPDCARGCS
jgi:hypothetical protein